LKLETGNLKFDVIALGMTKKRAKMAFRGLYEKGEKRGVRVCPTIPSPLRERVGVRVQVLEFIPPHLASPPQGGKEFPVIGQTRRGNLTCCFASIKVGDPVLVNSFLKFRVSSFKYPIYDPNNARALYTTG